MKTTVCTFVVLYTHIWQIHIHTQSLVLMQVGYEKNVGEVLCISVCAWNIL